jgi:UDP-4-amino-4-deoxy-L-arabinose-oxoglutarate aminotransferase
MKVLPGSKSARHLFTIMVPPKKRDEVMQNLQDKGIGVAVNFRAIHLLSYYRQTFGYKRGSFPIAERIGDSTITLPLYPKLTDEEVQYVINMVIAAVTN